MLEENVSFSGGGYASDRPEVPGLEEENYTEDIILSSDYGRAECTGRFYLELVSIGFPMLEKSVSFSGGGYASDGTEVLGLEEENYTEDIVQSCGWGLVNTPALEFEVDDNTDGISADIPADTRFRLERGDANVFIAQPHVISRACVAAAGPGW